MTNGNIETEELVRRYRLGDDLVLEEMFSRHRERLRRMVALRLDWRLSSRVSEDDVLQEAYLEALRRLPGYLEDPNLPFFLWLRFITGQKLVDLHRFHLGANARDPRREVRLRKWSAPQATTRALADHFLGSQTSPSGKVVRAELQLKIQEALDVMSPEDREVLILRHYEELTHREIARELGIERSTATKRYFRALGKIRQILASMPGGPGESWLNQKA